MKIEAFQIAEVLNLKKFKQEYTSEPLLSNNSELFYQTQTGQYVYLLSYGVVVFADFNPLEQSSFIKFTKNYAENWVEEVFQDDFDVQINASVLTEVIRHNSITVATLNDDAIRIMMLNIAQSVALDYYESLTYAILKNTRQMTDQLELHGKLHSSQKALLRFIGKTLNVKNSIIDNLYIFDSPDETWENEYLERIDKGLKKVFDLKMRYQDIDYKLKIVQETLTLFTELVQNRESTRLEWIIIVLILIEVFDLLLRKIF